MTKEQIISQPSDALLAIVRSTNPAAPELNWARDELTRRSGRYSRGSDLRMVDPRVAVYRIGNAV